MRKRQRKSNFESKNRTFQNSSRRISLPEADFTVRYFTRESLIDPIKWRCSIMQIFFLIEIERRDLIFVLCDRTHIVNRSKPDIVLEVGLEVLDSKTYLAH